MGDALMLLGLGGGPCWQTFEFPVVGGTLQVQVPCSDTPAPLGRVTAIYARDYADPLDADSTAGLQAGIDESIARRLPFDFENYRFRHSATLTAAADSWVVRGTNPFDAGLIPTGQNFDALVIGNDTSPHGGRRTGRAEHFSIMPIGADAPCGYTAGLVLDGMRHFNVVDVSVGAAPVAFDLRRNCFGTRLDDTHTAYGASRIGLRLRGEGASGNDITIINAWLMSRDAAVWCDPWGGGYRFLGGQLNCGSGATSQADDRACIVSGRHLETGDLGSVGSITCYSTSFETPGFGWGYRALGQGSVAAFYDCPFNAWEAEFGAVGVAKLGPDGAASWNEGVLLSGCEVNGHFSQPGSGLFVPQVHPDAHPSIYEVNTRGLPICAGVEVDLNQTSMCDLANVPRSMSYTHSKLVLDGTRSL